MKYLLLFLLPIILYSQDYSNTITVDASSTSYLEANVIKFRINLRIQNPNPQTAFDQHKELEHGLLQLLTNYNIPDTSVVYSLLNIRKRNDRNTGVMFNTDQEVIVTLNDISDYTKFQISLLENGFYEFSGVFSTNDLTDVKENGYAEALKLAMTDAQAVATAMNKNLGEILEVKIRAYETPFIESRRGASPYLIVKSSDKDLTEIEQSIEVKTRIEVKFKIID